jgi:hypothetical protein
MKLTTSIDFFLLSFLPCCFGKESRIETIDFTNFDKSNVQHRRLPSNTLTHIGNDGGYGFPLDICQGDCDDNSECKHGLVCFKRPHNEPVPGCIGDKPDLYGVDFCIVPPAPVPMPMPVPVPVPAPQPVPKHLPVSAPTKGRLTYKQANGGPGSLDRCQGDCDKDSECKSGLKCFFRSNNYPIPGCTGDKKSWSGVDFCYKPLVPVTVPAPVPVPQPVHPPVPVPQPVHPVPTKGTLTLKGNNGAAGILDFCQGDCDSDDDCKSGLTCFQRKGDQTVPGCTGDRTEWYGIDFCIKIY